MTDLALSDDHEAATPRGDLHEELTALLDRHGWVDLLFMARTIAEADGRDELADAIDTVSEQVELE